MRCIDSILAPAAKVGPHTQLRSVPTSRMCRERFHFRYPSRQSSWHRRTPRLRCGRGQVRCPYRGRHLQPHVRQAPANDAVVTADQCNSWFHDRDTCRETKKEFSREAAKPQR